MGSGLAQKRLEVANPVRRGGSNLGGSVVAQTPFFFTVNRHTPRRISIERVSDLIDAGSKTWKTALFKECFNKEDSELILSIPISSTRRRDCKIWHSSSDGHFIVKSAYHLEKENSIARPENLVAQVFNLEAIMGLINPTGN